MKRKGKTEEYTIGEKSGQIKITKGDTQGAAFNVGKEANGIFVDDQGYAVIEYT